MFRSKRPAEMRATPEGKRPTPLEDDAEECLHCAIIDIVEERIAAGGADQPCSPDRGEPPRRHPPGTGGGAGEAYGAHAGGFGRLLSSQERRRRRQLRIDALTGENPTITIVRMC